MTCFQPGEFQRYLIHRIEKKKKVYICQPVNYIDEGLKHMDIWSGYIFYKTNANSRKVGFYGFMLDIDNDPTYKKKTKGQPEYMRKLSPMWYVNKTLYKTQSEENVKLFPDLKLEENFLIEKNKAIFTLKKEAEQYIKDIKNNIIKLPEVEHIVTMKTWYKDKDGNKIEETSVKHLPSGRTDVTRKIVKE